MGLALARAGLGRGFGESGSGSEDDARASGGGAAATGTGSARRRIRRWAAPLLLVVAANFPDADFLLGVVGSEAYLFWHRGLTHSLVGFAVYPPALAFLAHAVVPGLSFHRALLMTAVAFVSHILLDVPTTWGTMVLYPWSHERFALDWVFIVDPVLWAVVAGGILFGIGRDARAQRRGATAGLLLAGLYVVLAGALHELAVSRMRGVPEAKPSEARARKAGNRPGDPQVFPLPLSPWRWHGVAWSGDSLVHAELKGIPPRIGPVEREPHGLDDATVRRALFTRPGQAFLWWARAPAGRVLGRDGSRTVVALGDRRYAFRGREVFGLEIAVGDKGELLGAAWEGDSVFVR